MVDPQPPDPGCPVCRETWQRRATVFDQYGLSHSERVWFYRCIVCDSRWEATLDHLYPHAVGVPFPHDREPPSPTDLGPGLTDAVEGIRPSPPDDLPPVIRVGPVRARVFSGGRIVIPFAERIPGSWSGTPLASHVAPLAALALALDAVLPGVDVREGGSYTFHAEHYRDRTGAPHGGYGLSLAATPTRAQFERAVAAPQRASPGHPPDPVEIRTEGERIVRMGVGVNAPIRAPFNVVEFGSLETAHVSADAEVPTFV